MTAVSGIGHSGVRSSGPSDYRARYYDTSAGRFLSEDPTKEVIRGMNFYAYARNSAPNLVDPSGRGWEWLWKLLERFKFAFETKEKIQNPIDWGMCGVYYVNCITTYTETSADLAQVWSNPNSPPGTYELAVVTLAQQTGSNSMSSLKLFGLCKNDENCQKAAKCAKKHYTNPLPFPFPLDDDDDDNKKNDGPGRKN